ncbi:glycosyltransferase [Sphingobacterium paludis]|uniref:Glycosyltransferase involved in cell wall biosynthesis n=1 Tax=Sphingobacterium paludis TaxID=1476465 RepID=A0A4R7D0X5_9SPHI|nr:glycosyltransferase [Sphingobacterium paludis]TDS13882.1 glycosyltransferase involved in cell wall biosynthesis [Sphingobacterium paludis]
MASKVKILFGLEAGDAGALKHLVSLACGLNSERFSITVILSPARSSRVFKEIDKMTSAGINVLLFSMASKVAMVKDIRLIRKLTSHLQENRYDIVHAHSSKAGLTFRIAARLAKIDNIIYTPHCFYFQGKTGFRLWVFSLAERVLGRFTTKLIVSSNEELWARKQHIVSSEKLTVIQNAIQPDEYRPAITREEIKEKFEIPAHCLVVGGVGRLSKQKDWKTFICAAREVLLQHKDLVFVIAGDGELFKQLESLITDLALKQRVMLLGHVEEMRNVYPLFDIFVSSSLWEGLPYSLLEAMHFKLPVIASDIGYADILVDQYNALLYRPKDHMQLAEMIMTLIENPSYRERLAEHAYASRCDFEFSRFIEAHEKLYLSLSN